VSVSVKYSEQIAKTVIETICVGSEMRFRCDQNTSVPDFDLRYADGTDAVVEVTESVERTWLETTSAIQAKQEVRAKKCRYSWWLHPSDGANIRKIYDHSDEYLARIELEGLREFPFGNFSQLVTDICRDLQIQAGYALEPKPHPIIVIGYPSRGGTVSAQVFLRAIEAEANKEDNRRKLSPFGGRERHLFVYLDSRNLLPWRVVVNCSPPPDVPSIPHEITHIWVAALHDLGREASVWKLERGQSWQSLGVVAIPPPEDRFL
jgi:hypothetical protein